MSGYSPTWTSKGSDKLRALQVTKILLNSLTNLISSLDLSDPKNEARIVNIIAGNVYVNFTPNRDLTLVEQFELFLELLGWKTQKIEIEEEVVGITLGANRFVLSEADKTDYLALTTGIIKAFGYFHFNSEVIIERIPSKFDIKQLYIVLKSARTAIPVQDIGGKLVLDATTSACEDNIQTSTPTQNIKAVTESKPEQEIRANIEVNLASIFTPILIDYPTGMILPIFHQVLSEILNTFFSDIEDEKLKTAKTEYTDTNLLFMLEMLLVSILDDDRDMEEIGSMVGNYVAKALKAKKKEDLRDYLPKELKSTLARSVSYVDFPARAFCTYAPGEKCLMGKRDLCDLIMYIWQGLLVEVIPEKEFKLGERINATRRGKFCLVEFTKHEE